MKLNMPVLLILGFLSTAVQAQSRPNTAIQPVYPSPQFGVQSPAPNSVIREGDAKMPSTPASQGRPPAGELSKPLAPPGPMTSLAPVSENSFTYLCGGVGSDEAAEMKRLSNQYQLMLTFAARNGSYLADVRVKISDARGGMLLKASCDAPIMLLKMPKAASYRIQAETGGYTVTRTAVVKKNTKGKQIRMLWPEPVAKVETKPAN